MSLFTQLARVREAQVRLVVAREELSVPAAALLARGHRYPLSTVGVAAGAGFVLGRLKLSPLRVPGLSSLLSGGLAELMAYGSQLVAGLDLGGAAAGSDPSPNSDPS
jgi:hypothetical protein